MKIVYTGPVLTKSGYGVHSRQIYSILKKFCTDNDHELTVNPTTWGHCGWYVGKHELGGLVEEILSHVQAPPKVCDLHVIVDLPQKFLEKRSFRAKKVIGVTAGVEATEVPASWPGIVNNPNLSKVVVPSEFTKNPIVRQGASAAKIEVIPESYFPELLQNQPPFLELESDRNVLFVSQIFPNAKLDRKNFFNAMRSIQGGLAKLPDVGIVLKLNSVGRGTLDRIATKNSIKGIISQMGIKNSVTLVHGELNDSEMASLYQHPKISCLFSMTRGEGFGLPLLEAGVAGLPIIASDWSAHTEFLDGLFVPLKGKEVPVPKEKINGLWVGGNWFEPDADEASRVLHRFFTDSKFHEMNTTNADILKKSLQSRYSLDKIYASYENLFRSVLKR